MKDWAVQSFGDAVGEKFADEEIDGAILLSQTVRTEEAMEKLGLHTIGKKLDFSIGLFEEMEGGSIVSCGKEIYFLSQTKIPVVLL